MIKKFWHLGAGVLMATTAATGLVTAGVAHAAELHNDRVGTYYGTPQQTPYVQCKFEADDRNKSQYGSTNPRPEFYYCAEGDGISYNLWWAHYR
ncbi:hypothetical protein OHT61_11430 [Streptomyces sp. NBC_00178]|uniref:hypothetical protein n=1 Tax=Streptomyces sp. NBC_00178 TaxID=2975672 RepID=UPI002E2E40E9|nr:hypothetical protein [Streptomyces sp. NBC_00178]